MGRGIVRRNVLISTTYDRGHRPRLYKGSSGARLIPPPVERTEYATQPSKSFRESERRL
jgi:hypothetical protein